MKEITKEGEQRRNKSHIKATTEETNNNHRYNNKHKQIINQRKHAKTNENKNNK